MIGCGGGNPCDQVLNSKWSAIAGVLPVSSLAAGVYLAMLIASLFIGPYSETEISRMAWSAMLVMVGTVAGSVAWFIIVQKWILGDFCFYCMTLHTTGLLLAILVIWKSITEFDNFTNNRTARRIVHPLPVVGRVLIGMVLAGILVVSQVSFGSSATYEEGESQNGLAVIDYHSIPMVGSSDAPYIVTLLFDYQCSHCQKIHFMLDEVVHRYAGKLAFALSPTPLNSKCNMYISRDVDTFKNSCELARIGLAVWVAKREVFSTFENWMFTFESGNSWRPRSLEKVREKVIELIGQQEFVVALSDPWIEQYMQTCIRIYGQTVWGGKGGIPKLIFGSHWVIPEPRNADDLITILQNSLAVPKP